MRLTLRSPRTFREEAVLRGVPMGVCGVLAWALSGNWWMLLVPVGALLGAWFSTRGPMHTRGTVIFSSVLGGVCLTAILAAFGHEVSGRWHWWWLPVAPLVMALCYRLVKMEEGWAVQRLQRPASWPSPDRSAGSGT